ncbi:MAG: Putative oxidoreductase, partial [uncultured Nocardioides sp.]
DDPPRHRRRIGDRRGAGRPSDAAGRRPRAARPQPGPGGRAREVVPGGPSAGGRPGRARHAERTGPRRRRTAGLRRPRRRGGGARAGLPAAPARPRGAAGRQPRRARRPDPRAAPAPARRPRDGRLRELLGGPDRGAGLVGVRRLEVRSPRARRLAARGGGRARRAGDDRLPQPDRHAHAGEGPRAGGADVRRLALDQPRDRGGHHPPRPGPARGRDDPRRDRAPGRAETGL